MTIAVIAELYGQNNNGTAVAVTSLIDSLKKKGHRVKVVSTNKDTEGMKDHYVLKTKSFGFIMNKILKRNEVEFAKTDKKLLREAISDAEVVYLTFPSLTCIAAAKIAKALNKPIIASFHCQAQNVTSHIGLINSRLANKLIYHLVYGVMFKYCDMIHFPTEFIKEEFEKNIKKKVPAAVISNGVNDEFFNDHEVEKDTKFTIVCTGRYSKEKSQEDLIKAVGLSKHKNDIRIVLPGSGPRRKKYERLVKRYGVDCQLGFLKREELIETMHRASLYVHTSVAEIEAIACMEAIVSSLVALICSSKESATKKFSADDFCLFGKHDYKTLRDKIDLLFEDEELLLTYKEKYNQKREGLRKSVCMDQMEAMIKEVIEKHEK